MRGSELEPPLPESAHQHRDRLTAGPPEKDQTDSAPGSGSQDADDSRNADLSSDRGDNAGEITRCDDSTSSSTANLPS